MGVEDPRRAHRVHRGALAGLRPEWNARALAVGMVASHAGEPAHGGGDGSALGFACFITLFTTSQTKLVRGLTSLGMPYKAGLTLATALRYIPVFFSIFQSVSEAQRARGLDLSGKVNAAGKKRNIFVRLVDRFKSYLPIIIAVLIRAYKMSQSVGWAMESRGLNLNRNGVKRTYRVNLTMSIADWIILVIAIAATAGSVWLMTWLS